MAGEFSTSEESLRQLSAFVLNSFPQSQAELYLVQVGGNVLSKRGSTAKMLDLLRNYCAQFPRSLLRLRADHPYGIVVMLWCHCTLETGCEIKCACDADRPRAVLVISVPAVGNKLSPHCQAAISTQARLEMTLARVEAGTD